MEVTSLAAVVAPRTGKIVKNGIDVYERRENLLQNGILHFDKMVYYTLCLGSVNRQNSRCKVRI